MRGYTIDRNHSPCNLNPNGVSCQCHHQLYKSGSKTQRQDKKCRFSVTWKYVRKGHFCNGCTQVLGTHICLYVYILIYKCIYTYARNQKGHFWRIHATDFWATDAHKVRGKSRMCTTYILDARNLSHPWTSVDLPVNFFLERAASGDRFCTDGT